MTRSADRLRQDIRDRLFTPRRFGSRLPEIGAEVEGIVVAEHDGARCPLESGNGLAVLPFLRQHGAASGWTERRSSRGTPYFTLPDGGTLTLEPGAQLEYSSPRCASATGLLDRLGHVFGTLRLRAQDQGLRLLTYGIDPYWPVEAVPLQLQVPRYRAMTEYFTQVSPAGVRMMRQTAALQVSLDYGADHLARWRLLNAAAPWLVAMFANSAQYAGRPSGYQSFRAETWRRIDPLRTGLSLAGDDPAAAYADFALAAPAMLRPRHRGAWPSFGAWWRTGGASVEDWEDHLSTLFPEVRPRGYFEVRSIDALPPEWYAAPIALLAGLTYHRPSLLAALELLGPPDPALLAVAGREGLAHPRLAAAADPLFELGLAGAAALGERFFAGRHLETAHHFRDRFTRRGLAPADESVELAASG